MKCIPFQNVRNPTDVSSLLNNVYDYNKAFERLDARNTHLGPVVQSVVSLTSSLRVISLTVLADSIYNILIFFAKKM